MDYAFKLTTCGRAVLAACGALETPLRISRVAVGSGKVPEDVNLADVHELYHYVADGTISERRHENDRLYLTVQYANSEHQEVPTFHLSEFIVYACHPETGEETDLLYATLGSYEQPVPAYHPELPGNVFNFPMIIVVSDEIEVEIAASPGLVTHDDLQRMINEGVIGISRMEVTIPAEGWTEADEPLEDITGGTSYPYDIDVPITGAKSRMTPSVTIYPQYLDSAQDICPVAETVDGAVRLFAKEIPAVDLKAGIVLIGGSGYISSGSGGGGEIPVATRETLGGIKLGDGLSSTADGTTSVKMNVASDDEVAEMLDEVFTDEISG